MKTVLITGSSKGLGKALALAFAKQKHHVIIHGRDFQALSELRSRIEKGRGKCSIVCEDINGILGIEKLASAAKRDNIDIFINNAGMHMNKAFHLLSEKEITDILTTNLLSPVLLTKRIFDLMMAKKAGLIINVNSIAGKESAYGEAVYCASKHGLRGFSRSLQYEATANGVRIIDVFLGRMQTALHTGHKDYNKYIDTADAADSIVHIAKSYKSMRITEIDILRKIY